MSGPGEFVAALAGLPGAGSARLGRLLAVDHAPTAWHRVTTGRVAVDVAPAATRATWRAAAADIDVRAVAVALESAGVVATSWHDDRHPPQFTRDIDPAPVAFRLGRQPDPGLPHVALVGTRRASGIGREVARELGATLAAAGVVVVSGLALGVDGAAHRGAVLAEATPPVAVVGSGCDVPYPRAHRELWADVASRGAVLSEAPLGSRPEPWRFPARNRLIVAMSDLVVVVESRRSGGSLLTVDEAVRRGVDVMAVPGSLRNGAAAGTNQLIADGCAPVLEASDITVALGLDQTGSMERRADPTAGAPDGGGPADEVLASLDDGPASVDDLAARSGVGAAEVFARIARLELAGLVVRDGARVRRA